MKKPDDIRRANLARLVDAHGLTAVGKRMRKPASQINDMLAGRKSFGEKVARAMEREWDASCPVGWLDRDDDPAPVLTLLSNRSDENNISIPQFETGGAMGAGLELRDQPGVIQSWRVSPEWLQKNVKGYSAAANLCIVTGFGDSMRPMFNPGDPLLVDTAVRTVEGDAVYFFRVEREGFIKRLQRIPGQGLTALSENKAYREWVIHPDMDFEVFGRVLKVWRSEDF